MPDNSNRLTEQDSDLQERVAWNEGTSLRTAGVIGRSITLSGSVADRLALLRIINGGIEATSLRRATTDLCPESARTGLGDWGWHLETKNRRPTFFLDVAIWRLMK
jgi:hypothetical protein